MSKFLKGISFKRLLLASLIIRLSLLPLSFHSDLNTNAIWGIYAREFGLRGFYDWLNFGNYARPDYPPFAMILFQSVRIIWEYLFNIFWKINVSLSIFPSNFVPWFETKGYLSLIKLPGIIADAGIGLLIYNYIKQKKEDLKAKIAASLFLFNPAMIYVSSSWGQLDSIVSFFVLLAIYLVKKKRYLSSMSFYFISIMTKATFVPAGLLLILKAIKQKITLKKISLLILILLLYLFAIGYIFIDKNYILWTINTYTTKILPGAITLPYINLNAFNFWGAILGLDRIRDNVLFLSIPLNIWAWVLTIPFILVVIKRYLKYDNINFSMVILYLSLFMFMPRVHERYLYPVFVFLPLVAIQYRRLLKPFLGLSLIFFLNLYHWWWFPRVNILVNLLDVDFIERLLSFINLILFWIILRVYTNVAKKT